MKKIMFIFGTRPEFIKVFPVIKEFEKHHQKFDLIIVNTGQHKEMLDGLLTAFKVKCDYNLEVMGKSSGLSSILSNTIMGIEGIMEEAKPDFIFVHGDTSATLAGSLVAFYHQIPIGHIEAGLRTYNKFSPFPEEVNRQITGIVADMHFTPTLTTKEYLLNENKDPKSIYVVGNSAIDMLKYTVKSNYSDMYTDWVGESKLILVTAHRRENISELVQIFEAFNEICEQNPDVKLLYPIHLNPQIRAIADKAIKSKRIKIIEPLETVEFHNLLNQSYLVLTDSGGIQEEAPSLGKPVLVMRDTTERPEGVEAGTLKLVGTNKNTIVEQANILLQDTKAYQEMSHVKNPYGDGTTSQKIVEILSEYLGV